MNRPESSKELFIVFSKVAMQGFGGVLPIIQREMVEKQAWYDNERFLQDWAVAQVLPGANVVNFALILGDRYFGWRGACAALSGILLAPLFLMLILASVYRFFEHEPIVAGMLSGLGAAAAGLIGAASLKLMRGLKGNPLGNASSALIVVATFIAIVFLRFPLVYVVFGLGIPSCYLAWRGINKAAKLSSQTTSVAQVHESVKEHRDI